MNKITYIIFFIILSSCSNSDINPSISFDRIQKDYQNNGYYENINSDNFKLIRKVVNGESGLEISYMKDGTTFSNDVQKVLIVRKNKKTYTIPFFSNSFRQYWSFENEKPNDKTPKTKLTISDELVRCIAELELSDTTGSDWILFGELFNSVLDCRNITIKDTLNLPMCAISTNARLFGEDDFYENERKRDKHLESIKIGMQNDSTVLYYDEDNCRLYELKYLDYNWHNKPCKFELKTYRYDYVRLSISL